ncbi:hypothetical protein D3C72_2351680 [compost metagenome]
MRERSCSKTSPLAAAWGANMSTSWSRKSWMFSSLEKTCRRPASILDMSSNPSISPERWSAERRMTLMADWRAGGIVSSRSRIWA